MAKQPRLERGKIIEQRRGSATPPYNPIPTARAAFAQPTFSFFPDAAAR